MERGTLDITSPDDSSRRRTWAPAWALLSRKAMVQLAVVVAVVIVAVITVVVVTNDYVKSHLTSLDRVRCLEPGVEEARCLKVGCVWTPRVDAPSCYYPPASVHGYQVTTPPESVSPGVTRLTVELKATSAWVVPAMKEHLLVEMTEYGGDVFRIKITVPGEERYEVPVPLELPEVTRADNPRYSVAFTAPGSSDFAIIVTRTETDRVIFDTSIGGMTYADQFLQVSTKLTSDNLYGLGEATHLSLRHNLNYITWPMLARDQPPGKIGENLYGVHPVYLVVEETGSSHAVLWLNSNAMEAETMPLPGLTLRSIGGVMDLYFFLGPSPMDALQQYTLVVGPPALPPYWALGFHLCRYGYNSLDNLKAAVSRTRRRGIPQDVQYADIDYMDRRMVFTYNEVNFAGLPEYIREVKGQGLRFILILDPAVNAEMKAEYPIHARALLNDVYIKWPQDVIPQENFNAGDIMLGYVWPDNRTAFPDFFRNSTKEWWQEEIVLLHKTLEFDGLWIDMNEPANFGTNEPKPWNWPENRESWSLSCPNSTWDDPPYPIAAASTWGQGKRMSDKTLCMVGLQGEERELRHYDVHNLYGWSQTRPTLQAVQAATQKRGVVVSRSTFPSSGRWAGHWLGDNTALWSHLRQSIIGMIEFNMFGMPHVGADICGFFQDTTEELCARWSQLGAFYPYSRNHNTLSSSDQDPGLWPSVASSARAALQVRYTLLPYLYTLHYLAHTQGLTVVRALFFEFPNISDTWTIDDQFLWGSWLMVTPVIEAGQTLRSVYFPAGVWYDYYTGEAVNQTEGRTLVVQAPPTHIPVYVRGGGVLLTQRPRANTMLARKEPLGLIVAPDWEGRASGTFYWDDGEAVDPVDSGEYFTAKVTYSQERISWEVDHSDSVAGPLVISDVRVFGVGARPSHLLLNGERWTTGDWHYDDATREVKMFDLAIPILENFELYWSYNLVLKLPCPLSYGDWSETDPVTEDLCLERNCVWDRSSQVSCSLPPLTDYGFVFHDGLVEKTSDGFLTVLRKLGASLYPDQVETITFQAFLYSDDTVRLKFYHDGERRYEVPLEVRVPVSGAKNPLYEVVLPSKHNPGDTFFFYVVRKDTGTILFDTRIGGLTLTKQFLSISSTLPSKNVYGLGENAHDSFRHDLGGKTWPIFARDQGPLPGVNQQVNLYGAHPYYQCVENDGRAHGLLLLNSNAIDYQLLDYPAITFRTIGGVLDLYLMLGPQPETVVSQYTALIHRPSIPPYWALGFHLSRYGYQSLDEMKAAVVRTRAAGIPQDVQYGDIDYMDRRMDFSIDQEHFGDLPSYVETLKADGVHFVAILDPAINAELDGEEYGPHQRALEADAYIKWPRETTQEALLANNGGNLSDVMLGYDMNEPANFGTNEPKPWNWPEDREPWSLSCPNSIWDDPPYVTKAASHGPSKRMSDKTLCLAASLDTYRHYDVHNLYGWAQTQPTHRAVQEASGKRGLVVSRSSFPGSGRWTAHWLGDNRSNWTDMAHSIIGMLEFNLFGMPHVGADICGYFQDTTEELCARWSQLGAFYPYSRNHNNKHAVDQDPGMWPETVGKAAKIALEIRYRLLPYLYTLFYLAHTEGHTVVRPLVHEFPEDRRTLGIDDQFLWGGCLMVSPVLKEGDLERRVYFPHDFWYDYYTGKPIEWPGEYVKVPAPWDVIPLHIRGGHILPTQRPALNTFLSRRQPLGVLVAIGLDRRASGQLFWDDGESIDTIGRRKYSLLKFTFIQNWLRMTVFQDLAHDLQGLKMVDLEFLGVEKEPSEILLNQVEHPLGSYTYEADSLRLRVTVKVDLDKDFVLELKDIWRFTVDL
nr:maltase-glucoamylase-like isoform X2 [Cherax quadricarinatus]